MGMREADQPRHDKQMKLTGAASNQNHITRLAWSGWFDRFASPNLRQQWQDIS